MSAAHSGFALKANKTYHEKFNNVFLARGWHSKQLHKKKGKCVMHLCLCVCACVFIQYIHMGNDKMFPQQQHDLPRAFDSFVFPLAYVNKIAMLLLCE